MNNQSARRARATRERALLKSIMKAHVAVFSGCWICRNVFPEHLQYTLVPDHIIPVSKGGLTTLENIQPACGPCNSKKAGRVVDNPTKTR